MFHIKLYCIALAIFLGLDGLWLSLIARSFYTTHLGYIMRTPPLWWAAILFYALNIIGLLIFVIEPALKDSSLSKALLLGALFGFFTYATYDLTNLATVKDWPLLVTIVDLIWGSFISCIVSGLTYWIATKI